MQLKNNHNPPAVGVLDSGIGGLSVLREIQARMPGSNLIYFADQAHVPYGPRPVEQIRAFSGGISQFLIEQGARVVVVACNTASAAALYYLREMFPTVPFVGMEPAVKPAAQQSESLVVGVIATPVTFTGELFAGLIQRYARNVTVLEKVCPGLVEQVENGELDSPETFRLLHEYIDPLLDAGMDVLVLGCTHYPFLMPAIRKVVGADVKIVDPSPAVARQTERVFLRGIGDQPGGTGSFTCYSTGDPGVLKRMVEELTETSPKILQARWQGKRIQC